MTTAVGPSDRATPQHQLRDAVPAVPDAPGLVRARLHDHLDPLLTTRLGVVVGMAGTGKTTALAHWAMTRADCERLEEMLLSTQVRLVVLSREMPPFNLARSELPARVVHATSLRFRAEETAELFRTYGAPLSETDAERLTHHTAGWPAAIRLFHHSLDGADAEARHRAVAALPGATSYVEPYLAGEVLTGLEEHDLDLLRRTSVLDPLTGERCDALLGTQDSERRLRTMCRTGIVAEHADGIRLHPVVRSHLLAKLRAEVGSAGMGVLERRSERLEGSAPTPDPGDDRADRAAPPVAERRTKGPGARSLPPRSRP